MEKEKTKAKKSAKKYLVIVESPAKAHTIGKFLGNNYKIEASMGHIPGICQKVKWGLILTMILNQNISPFVAKEIC